MQEQKIFGEWVMGTVRVCAYIMDIEVAKTIDNI